MQLWKPAKGDKKIGSYSERNWTATYQDKIADLACVLGDILNPDFKRENNQNFSRKA